MPTKLNKADPKFSIRELAYLFVMPQPLADLISRTHIRAPQPFCKLVLRRRALRGLSHLFSGNRSLDFQRGTNFTVWEMSREFPFETSPGFRPITDPAESVSVLCIEVTKSSSDWRNGYTCRAVVWKHKGNVLCRQGGYMESHFLCRLVMTLVL